MGIQTHRHTGIAVNRLYHTHEDSVKIELVIQCTQSDFTSVFSLRFNWLGVNFIIVLFGTRTVQYSPRNCENLFVKVTPSLHFNNPITQVPKLPYCMCRLEWFVSQKLILEIIYFTLRYERLCLSFLNKFFITVGQTFCDLPTHLHHFYHISMQLE